MNIENLTVGAITISLASILGLVTTWLKIKELTKNAVSNVVKEELAPLTQSIADLSKKIDSVDMNSTKDYLVSRFAEIERGETLDPVSRQRMYEEYEHYCSLGGNSYIKARFDELKKANKL